MRPSRMSQTTAHTSNAVANSAVTPPSSQTAVSPEPYTSTRSTAATAAISRELVVIAARYEAPPFSASARNLIFPYASGMKAITP